VNLKTPYYFIKPPVRKTQNHIPEYCLVTTPLLLSEIKGLETMVKMGIQMNDYTKNVIRLDEYIKRYSTFIVSQPKIIPEIQEF
jgi:hypothetical protein